jgi:hypothetical protein
MEEGGIGGMRIVFENMEQRIDRFGLSAAG